MQKLAPRLRFEPLQVSTAAPARQVELLREFEALLADEGMASMDEYGDMLKWALPSKDGWCRYFHAYHPGFCSFDDRFRGTIHDHGGIIRGTVLLGAFDHQTYEPTPDEDGDRVHAGTRYRLRRHTTRQRAGDAYDLAPFVPHWPVPTEPTLTYFEEQDNQLMGELADPVDGCADEHLWDQARADAFSAELADAVARRLQMLGQ